MQERLWLASLQVTSLHLLLFALHKAASTIPVNSPITPPISTPSQNIVILESLPPNQCAACFLPSIRKLA